MSDDGKTANEDKPTAAGGLESKSREELLKLSKAMLLQRKKFEATISEFNTNKVTLLQTQETLTNDLEDEQEKTKSLTKEVEQAKSNTNKLQKELDAANESLECLKLQNETLKASWKGVQEDTLNYRNKINDLEQANLQLTQSIEDYKSQLDALDREKQRMDEELTNYRQEKSSEQITKEETVSITQNNDYEEYRLNLQREDHAGLNTLFEQLLSLMKQTNDSQSWQINLSKPVNSNTAQPIRLEVNDLKLVPEHELIELRSQLSKQNEHEIEELRLKMDQLSKDNEAQQHEIGNVKDLEQQLIDGGSRIDQLSKENEEKQQELVVLKEKLQSSEENDRDLLQLRSQFDQLSKDNEDKQQEIATLTEKLSLSQQDEQELTELRSKIEQLSQESQTQQSTLSDLKETEQQLEGVRAQLEELTREYAEKNRQISTLEENLRSSGEVGQDLLNLRAQLDQLSRENEDQREQIAILEDKLRSGQSIETELTDVRSKLNALIQEHEHKQQENSQLTEKLHSFEQDERALSQLQTQFDQLSKESEEQRELIASYENKLHSFDATEKEAIELRTKLEHLSRENEDKQHEILHSSHEVDQEVIQLRSQLEQISNENQERKRQIDILEEKLGSFEQLSTENETKQQTIATLQELTEQIRSEYNLLKDKSDLFEQERTDLQEINNKLKLDYERQHFYIQEREENIRLLTLELEEKKTLLNQTNENQDQRFVTLSKQHEQLSDLLQTKIDENKNLIEQNQQVDASLKEINQLFFEKTKQADDLDRQLQVITTEYAESKIRFSQVEKNQVSSAEKQTLEHLQMIDHLKQELEGQQLNFDQLRHEKEKLITELNLLIGKIEVFEKEKGERIQTIENLKQESQTNQLKIEENLRNSSEETDRRTQTENQLQQTINELRQEIDANKNLYFHEQTRLDQLEQENLQLNQKLDLQTADSENKLQGSKEKIQKMTALLARMKKELQEKSQQPKQSLIDLELADYEKTIKSLKEDLGNKDKDIRDLNDEISSLKEKSLAHQQEIDNLEQQKGQIDERANKFKALLDTTKKELQDAKDLEQERYQNEGNVRTLLDQLQIELDNNKVLLSQFSSEKQQLTERLNNQNETTQRTINLLEQNLRIAKHELDVAKKDYETLQDDFNNYKIRAQSVLKQHQSVQRERKPSTNEKQIELEETIEKLRTTLQEANGKIQLLSTENDALQKEQDRLTEVQSKILNEARKREQELRKQHQIELEKMDNDCLKRTNDSHDLMKNVTLQNESMSLSFKEQLASMEVDHQRSIALLQSQLQISRQEIEQLKTRLESVRQNAMENDKEPAQNPMNNDATRDELPWTFAERQQGEGSESASSDHPSTDIAVKTLENVLFGNSASARSATSNAEKPRHVLFEDVELERQRIEEELNRTKYRLLNTTELLNESELNNVRLTEQVTVLKDEIRRIERNMDRAESISNLEYLKNIVLKFFILKSSHERLQLIPVLVTMLKLSPDEQAKLVRVAQQTSTSDGAPGSNESATQSTTDNNPSSASWSSYLSMW